MRARLLLRRAWRATLLLAVLAGLAGAVSMAAWSIGRRASTAFDRFVAFAVPGDLAVTFCPPDMTSIDEASFLRCVTYDAVTEAAVLRQLPEVTSAGRTAFASMTVAPATAPQDTIGAGAILSYDEGATPMDGTPIIVSGRRPAPDARDEIGVNEQLAALLGVGVGDELDVTFAALHELGSAAEPGESFNGPRVRARIVGIERNLTDLLQVLGSGASTVDEARLAAGPAVAASLEGMGAFRGVAVVAAGGDVAAVRRAIDESFAGRLYQVTPLLDADDRDPIAEAIRYEAGGTMLVGAIVALAGAAFAGQAVSRQSRREWSDLPILRALGMDGRTASLAALARGGVTALLAAPLAIGAAVGLTTMGSFGIAGDAEVDRGPVVDPAVLGIGAVTVIAVVIVATWWPVRRALKRSRHRRSSAVRSGLPAVQAHVAPPGVAGLSMTFSGHGAGGLPTGTAVAGVALAIATALAAVALTASLDGLVESPERYGAPWDLSASTAVNDREELDAIVELFQRSGDVEAAAALIGTDAEIGDTVAWVQAFQPIDGVDGTIGPVITDGRAPATVDEIALGTTTMTDNDLSIGDTVAIRQVSSLGGVVEVTIVGTVIMNDSFENNAGRGGVVTGAWMEEFGDELSPDPIVVRLRPGADVERFRDELQAVASGGVNGPVLQGAIRNVQRVRWVPYLLAALVGVLAVASLAHALVLSVRRQRGQLAVLKSLGFRRAQVQSAVAWHASTLVLAAAVIGVPLGIIGGRWGWRLVADELGVASPPVTPLLWSAAIVIGVLVIANLAAAYPAWSAARISTARALHAE